jgi:hypothetical protein
MAVFRPNETFVNLCVKSALNGKNAWKQKPYGWREPDSWRHNSLFEVHTYRT